MLSSPSFCRRRRPGCRRYRDHISSASVCVRAPYVLCTGNRSVRSLNFMQSKVIKVHLVHAPRAAQDVSFFSVRLPSLQLCERKRNE